MVLHFVFALHDRQIMHVFLFQLQGLNARLTMNAQYILHVFVKNAKTRVKPIHVVSMQNVELKIIELCVFALPDLLAIQLLFVKNVS